LLGSRWGVVGVDGGKGELKNLPSTRVLIITRVLNGGFSGNKGKGELRNY